MKKANLATQVLIAFVIGTSLGIIFQKDILFLQPVGDIFLRLIQMIVIPLIFFSIIGGIANIGDISKLRRIGSKVVGFYVITTILSTIIGLAVANLMQPGKGFSAEQIVTGGETIKEAAPMTVGGTILSMIPDNPLHALSEGNIMQVIVFAAFLGIVMTVLGDKVSTVKKFVEEGTLIMFKLTDLVMMTTPFGVLALAACSIGEYGTAMFSALGMFILTHYVGAFSVIILLYLFIIKAIARIPLTEFFRKLTSIWLVAFSTTSSSGTLPVSLKVTEEEFHVKSELASFSLPLGATINMNGIAVYYAVTIIFVSQIYGVDLTLGQQAMFIFLTTLISIGTPGIPASGIVLSIMLLNTMGLPTAIMGMIVGIFRPIDMIHTALNVTGDVVSTLAVARMEGMYQEEEETASPQVTVAP
ncbi:MAG: dicarboxylate/amino acid:cation symporter [Selenomonas sp.]|nr:dicarboxylate/amino acid:cation symporter [Selenomonas sp.]